MKLSFSLDQLKPYLLPIIAVVVVILTVPLAIMPWYNDVQDNLSTMSAKNDLKTVVTAKADALDKMDYASDKDTLTTIIEPALPSEADPAGLLATLEQVAQATAVTPQAASYAAASVPVASVTVSSAAATAAPATIQATFTAEGKYGDIATFLSRLENTARVTSIASLHLSASSDKSGNVLVSFIATAPYVPYPTNLGSPDLALPTISPSLEHAALDKAKALQHSTYAPLSPDTIQGKTSLF